MKIPITITVYLKINGGLYSEGICCEAKNSFVLKDGADTKIDIQAIAEDLKNEIKQFTGTENVEFITQKEYEGNRKEHKIT